MDPVRARILIVDDDRAVCAALARMVSESGHELLLASSWTDAVRLYREGRPDLVVLDVMMPTIDGYKLTGILRRESGAFVPIILLTALEDLDSKRRGMAAGADDFLTKPVTQLELQIRVASLLRIKQLTDQLAAANLRLAELAVTDPLTLLHNRRHVYFELEREFVRSRRYGHPLSLMMLDVDHFKQVNDTHGHPIGDRVLKLLADILRGSVRATDLVGRVGGEEFMVLAPETGISSIGKVAERIRLAIGHRSAAAEGVGIPGITVSIGVATSEHPQVGTSEQLVRQADEALLSAKREGRNRVVVYGRPSAA
ncbi:MAG TPA: diguanylate cyclase [Polyangia bacterium]|nr:diguanylate cyclase [Polyangia bacterium]